MNSLSDQVLPIMADILCIATLYIFFDSADRVPFFASAEAGPSAPDQPGKRSQLSSNAYLSGAARRLRRAPASARPPSASPLLLSSTATGSHSVNTSAQKSRAGTFAALESKNQNAKIRTI